MSDIPDNIKDQPKARTQRPLFCVLVAYRDQQAVVFINKNPARCAEIRDRLRATYAALGASFNLTRYNRPPEHWLKIQAALDGLMEPATEPTARIEVVKIKRPKLVLDDVGRFT